MASDPTRRADLARIHIAKAALGLDDDTYRDILWAKCRARSSADLDIAKRKALIDQFVSMGWDGKALERPRLPGQPAPARKPRADMARPKRPTPASHVAPLCRRVRAQLISLGRRPDTYADGIAQRMFGVQFFEWCSIEQLRAIVTALSAEQFKHGADTGPTPRRHHA